MANPSPYTKLMSLIGKAETNANKHKEDISNHTAAHEAKRDAQRSDKRLSKPAGPNAN